MYVASDGNDAGDCTFIQPCRTLGDGALPRTSPTRNHIVMAPGEYGTEQVIRIDATRTDASELVIHGGGAHVTATNLEVLFVVALPVTIRDLSITYPGTAVQLSRPATLERVNIRAGSGVTANAQLTMRDVDIASTSASRVPLTLGSGASLRLERGILHGGRSAIQASSGTVVEISNLVAYGTSNVALDLSSVNGSIEFSTIADSGTAITTGARGLTCWSGLTLRSSIVWTPAGPPIVGDCTLVDVLAGPMAVAGASNANPQFVNGYHLGPNSPAKDAVDVGPALDYEGEPRPRGARYDIGADETD